LHSLVTTLIIIYLTIAAGTGTYWIQYEVVLLALPVLVLVVPLLLLLPVLFEEPTFSHCLKKGMHLPNSPAQRANTFAFRQYEPNMRKPCSGVVTENSTKKMRLAMLSPGNRVIRNLLIPSTLHSSTVSIHPKIQDKPMEMNMDMYTLNSFLRSLLCSALGAWDIVSVHLSYQLTIHGAVELLTVNLSADEEEDDCVCTDYDQSWQKERNKHSHS
jgi:hypothetical protein